MAEQPQQTLIEQLRAEAKRRLIDTAVQTMNYIAAGRVMRHELSRKFGVSEEDASRESCLLAAELGEYVNLLFDGLKVCVITDTDDDDIQDVFIVPKGWTVEQIHHKFAEVRHLEDAEVCGDPASIRQIMKFTRVAYNHPIELLHPSTVKPRPGVR